MTSRTNGFLTFVRYYSQHIRRRIKWKDEAGNPEAVKYQAVTYFPRTPNHVDPPFTPSKLLMVNRVKPFWGNPWWEKEVLKTLNLDEQKIGPVILKNTPEICGLLWKIKHLVKITPIKLPDKMPTTDDLNATHLHENGTFSVIPKIDPVRLEATEKYVNNPKKMTRDYLKEVLRLNWLKRGL